MGGAFLSNETPSLIICARACFRPVSYTHLDVYKRQILYGTGFFAALACVCIGFGLLGLLRVLPPVLGLVFLLGMVRLRPRGTLRALYADGGFLCRLALWGALAALFGLMVSVKNAHPVSYTHLRPVAYFLERRNRYGPGRRPRSGGHRGAGAGRRSPGHAGPVCARRTARRR